jgi:hypothetical protein
MIGGLKGVCISFVGTQALLLAVGCSGCENDGSLHASDSQEACELLLDKILECYPDEYTAEEIEERKEMCDPEVFLERCQEECSVTYQEGSDELEECTDQCVYMLYETGEEYCQAWCTEGGGDCDYCDDIWNDPCQDAYLAYDNCRLNLECDQLEDATDYCDDEKEAIIEACHCF